MNLMKCFNRNYMIQNIKKSKSILAFFLGIIPIISLLLFIVLITNAEYDAISLETISIVHFFGIYFIPVMLSICLFGFVYKKKSVDFIESMPLSRKTIFLSNTIGGILLILAMILLCALGIYFTSLFTGLVLPFRMISDYIVLWSITYIFVFVVSNVAMSVSGNISTQIIMTFILLFFVPFIVDYISGLSGLIYLQSESNRICLLDSDLCHYGYREITTSYTIPYNILHMLGDGFQVWNVVSIIKMTILSIIGYFVGYIFFYRRKMEVNETSFKSLKVHNIVKAFTMFPIILLIIEIVPDPVPSDSIRPLLIISIIFGLLIYYFIYDLITRKTITQVKNSLKHFMVTLVVLFGIGFLLNSMHSDSIHKIYVEDKDITGYQIPIDQNYITDYDYVTVKDKEIMSLLTEELKRNNYYEEGDKNLEIKILIKNIPYKIWLSIPSDTYDKLFEMIDDSKNIELADGVFRSNKVFALGAKLEGVYKNTTNSKLIKEAKSVVLKKTTCSTDKKLNVPIYLYAYQNGKVISYPVDSCTNEYLDDYVVSSIQKEIGKVYQESKYFDGSIWLMHYPNMENDTQEIRNDIQFRASSSQRKILSFIRKYHGDSFSSNKDYISVSFYTSNREYVFYTNRVDEFMELLKPNGDEKYDTN